MTLATFKQTIITSLKHSSAGLKLYIIILSLTGFYYLIRWPIVFIDTDLWYHLNGGRYIFENKSLPQSSFFSFVEPARDWIDYYWLFQVIVYKVYSLSGYYGLVFWRAILSLAIVFLIFIYLFHKNKEKDSFLYLTVLFALYFIFLQSRFQLIRPHLFSYFFIVCFLYILEFQSKKILYLPFITTLWTNLHGIEYPVMFLIILAFSLEFFVSHLKEKKHIRNKELSFIIPMIISLGAVYFTPHGSGLVTIPFVSTKYASLYISELQPLKLNDLISFQSTLMIPSSQTIVNLLLMMVFISLLMSIWKRQIRISHLVMFAGGFILLTKSNRFTYEFLLLSLPLFRAHPVKISLANLNQRKKLVSIFGIAIILFFPFIFLTNEFSYRPRYPFSPRDLPQGVVTFLNGIPAQGSVLNDPVRGGYVQWMLYPKYKIFMDMQIPFLFTDEDFFLASNVFKNGEILRKVLLKYEPSFIAVPISNKEFKELIRAYPDYVPVFFDHSEVLYLNKKHYPDVALEYAIKDLDPFGLSGKNIDVMVNAQGKDLLLKRLLKLIEIYPDCFITNQMLAIIFNREGDHKKAIPYAEAIIRNFPEEPRGYQLKGDALKGLKSYDESIFHYKMALNRSDEKGKREIYKQLGYVYMVKRQYDKAYNAFKKAINIFSSDTTYRDLFDLGSAALFTGKLQEAAMTLEFAREKVPPDDTQWKERIEHQLSLLGIQVRD